jgi:hypothetical protein
MSQYVDGTVMVGLAVRLMELREFETKVRAFKQS